LKELNLEDNAIDKFPKDLSKILPELMNLNLNGNDIDESDFKKVIESLNSIPNLESLYINLHEEEQVDLVMRILTDLQYLNGLPVERDMLEDESQESEMKEVVVNEVSQMYSASRTVEDEEVLKINNTAART